jgi:hypothetical protein
VAEQRKEAQAAGADHRQALPQVVVVVMAELVGQHRLDLGGSSLASRVSKKTIRLLRRSR